MNKRFIPVLRALLIITLLVTGQVQAVFADEAPDTVVQGAASVGAAPPADQWDNGCKVYVNTGMLAAPLGGAPDFDLPWPHGASLLNSDVDDVGSSPEVFVSVGETTSWFVAIENASDQDGDSRCNPPGSEELYDIEVEVVFRDTATSSVIETVNVALMWPDPNQPGVLPAHGDAAWATFDWIVPPTVAGNVGVRTNYYSEMEFGDKFTGWDILDGDDDIFGVEGPGFQLISFVTDPLVTEAALGETLDYTLIIENTRPAAIQQINASSASGLLAGCNGINNWTPVGGGDPLTAVAPGEQAQCRLLDVPVSGDPPPQNFRIVGELTVYQDASGTGLSFTDEVISEPVAVALPDIGIEKRVRAVYRSGSRIYSIDGTDPLPVVLPGDTIEYEIVVTNTGEVELTNIFVVDSLTGPQYVPQGTTLLPGESLDPFRPTYTVPPDSQDPLQNTATVTADAPGFTSVSARAIASVDVADSVLEAELVAVDPDTGDVLSTGIEPNTQVRYRLTVYNRGTLQVTNLTTVPVALPLKTVGTPPAFFPDSVPGGGQVTIQWDYIVTETDDDPLVSTVRVRGQLSGGGLLYAQAQNTLDLTSPGIMLTAVVTSPADTGTVLRGQTVQYQVTVTNTNSSVDAAICNILVNQIRRDPNTGLEYTVLTGIPLNWRSDQEPDTLAGGDSVSGATSYLVTGEDVDPLHMIFEVTAVDCATSAPLSDRTARVLDISDVQLNTSITGTRTDGDDTYPVGINNPAPVGATVDLTYQVINISAMTLENVSATWCVPHRPAADWCGLVFDSAEPNLPLSLGAFEDGAERFSYVITPEDATESPITIEVTLTGTDNKGKNVSIRTAFRIAVATPDLAFALDGVPRAVLGDTIPFDFTIVNETQSELSEVRVYNLLKEDPSDPFGFEEVAYFPTISNIADLDQNVETGTFDYTIDSLAGIQEDVLTMRVRLVGMAGDDQVMATAVHEVDIIPMVGVNKTGDESRPAGLSVHYAVTIRNNSQSQFLKITDYQDAVLAGYGVSVGEDDFGPWPAWGPEGENGPEPGVLPPGESVVGQFRIPGPPEDADAPGVNAFPSPLVNTFIVNGLRSEDPYSTGGEVVSGSGSHKVLIECPVGFNFQVENLDNDPDWVLGETLRWRISFRNISLDTIEGIQIIEDLEWGGQVDHIQWPDPANPGRLEPGQTAWIMNQDGTTPYFDKQITYEYYTGDGSTMEDYVRADFSEVGGAAMCEDTAARKIYSPIQLLKVPNVGVAFTGEEVDYLIVVRNVTEEDDAPYNNFYVTVYDSLLQPSPLPLQYNGEGAAETNAGWIGPGEQLPAKTVTREVQATDPEELKNVLTAEFYPDPNLVEENVTYITTTSAIVYTGNPLDLRKKPSVRKAAAGETITYDYTIANVSPYFVVVTSAIDDQMPDDPLIPDLTDGVIELDPGEVYNLLDIPFTIPLEASGSFENTFIVTGDVFIPEAGVRTITNSIVASVALEETDLQVEKSIRVDEDGDGIPEEGEEVTDTFGIADGIPDVESGTEVYYCFAVENTNPGENTYVRDITIQDNMFPTLQQTFEQAVLALDGHPPDQPNWLYGGERVEFCVGPQALTQSPELGDPRTNIVTVNGVSNEGRALFNEARVTVDIRGTTLLVTKLPSQTTAFVGDTITYVITLYNNDESTDVVLDEVIDDFISGAPAPIALEDFDWSNSGVDGHPVGRLGPGGQATYIYTYTVRADDPDPLENTVMATGWLVDNENPDDWTPVYDNTRSVIAVTDSQLIVRKTAAPNIANASPDNCGQPGGPACNTVSYSISITNQGKVPVYGVMAVDEHFDAISGQMVQRVFQGDDLTDTVLDPSETAFISYTLPMPTSSQIAAAAAGDPLDPFINTVTVYGQLLDANDQVIPIEDDDPDDPYDDDKSIKTIATDAVDIIQPGIRALKSPVTLAAAPGQEVLYEITITNTGSETLDNITFEDLLGGGVVDLDGLCMSTCNWVYSSGEQYEPVAIKLPPLERLHGSVQVTVPEDWTAPKFTNVIEVSAQDATGRVLTDRTSATIDVRDEGISVEKIAGASSAAIGSQVPYTVNVTNVGNTAFERIQIVDPGMDAEFDTADGNPDGVITIESGFPDDPDIEGDDSGTLDPGEVYTFNYGYTLTAQDGELYINRVTVTATTATGGAAVSVDSAAVSVEKASLNVEKFVCAGLPDVPDSPPPPDCTTVVNIGDEITPDTVTYYLHVANTGGIALNDITITDSMHGPITGPATLDPDDGVADEGSDEVWITYTYDVQPNDPDPLTNYVLVSGVPEGDTQSISATAAAQLALVTGDLVVEKSGPAQAVLGQTVTYDVTLWHAGGSSDPITDIVVYDPLSDDYGTAPITECGVVSLAAGETHECTISHTVTQADPSPLVNTVSASGTQGGVTVSDATTYSLVIATPGLSVSKTADKQHATIGDTVTYTYRIENTGTTRIDNLVVQESDPGATFSEPWPGYLLPGRDAVRTWTRTMSAADADPYTNTLTVTGTVGGEPILAQASETVYLANGALLVTNEPNVTFARDGQSVIFTYAVDNVGTDPIYNVTLEDNLCFVGGETVAAVLEPADPPVRLFCEVTASAPGPLVSSVYVQGNDGAVDGPLLSDTATAEVGVADGAVLLTKTADVRTVTTSAPDNQIGYTVTVTNIGDETLNFAIDSVEDSLVALSPAPPESLRPGASFRMTGTYTVTDPAPTSINNTATVTATGASTGATYADSDSAAVAVLENPDAILLLTKSASALVADPGDTITYTYTVQNFTPDTTATGVTLTDPLLPGSPVSLPDLGPGNAVTRSYDVTIPADWTEAEFTNTAEVATTEGVQDTASVTVDVNLLTLEKVASVPEVDETTGEFVITYTFTVTNNSTADVSGVALSDPMVDTMGGWVEELPDTIPGSGTETATATVALPVDTVSPVVNEATLTVNGIEEATASASTELVVSALEATIVSITQEAEDGTPLDLIQTGEPVTVEVELRNAGTTTLSNLDYSVTVDITADPPLTCDPVDPLPDTLAAGDSETVTCQFGGLPVGAEFYTEGGTIDLERLFTLDASAVGDDETGVNAADEILVELVDLQLGVDLTLAPADGSAVPASWLPGDEIQFALTITNLGASPIGCGGAVAADAPCHLAFDGGDDQTPDTEDSLLDIVFAALNDPAATDFLGNRVLDPGDSVTFDGANYRYTVTEDDVSLDLMAMVDGGYHDNALEADGLLGEYTVHGEDVGESLVIGAADITAIINVTPLPPIFGQPVTYTVTVINTGPVTVTGLNANYRIIPYAPGVSRTDGIMLVGNPADRLAQAPLAGTLTFPVTTLAPGEQVTSNPLSKIEDQQGRYQFEATVGSSWRTVNDTTALVLIDLAPVGSADEALDPSATEPVVTKTVDSETTQPGGTLTWTVRVRNSWTQPMTNVVLQDNVPSSLTITNVSVDRGAAQLEGQYVVVNAGQLNPGETVTLTLTTRVDQDVTAPAAITNTACAQNAGGPQACDTITANVGPDVGGLPATGIASKPGGGTGGAWFGLLSLGLGMGLLVLMGAAVSRRRIWIAVLFALVAVAIVVVAVVLALSRGDGDGEPTDVAGPAPTVTPEGGETSPATVPADGTGIQFPPTPTPYVVPTPAGLRALIIPKLDQQFDMPVPIVDLPVVNRQWDVSGLGHYIGWLEGTTWMDTSWGNTVLAAHVQLGHRNPGPFWGLGELVPGDEIIVLEGDTERRFRVDSVSKVDPNDWTVTAPTSEPVLTLITCTEWDNNYGVFSQRMVVRAVPVEAETVQS